jgi:leucyl aminopeptidase
MTIALSTTSAETLVTDLLVIPVEGDPARTPTVAALDRRLGGRLLGHVRRVGFRARPEEELVYQTHGAAPAAVIVLVGVGPAPSMPGAARALGDDAPLRPAGRSGVSPWLSLADAVVRHATRERARHAAVALAARATPAVVHVVSEGVHLARYRFDRYRSARAPALPTALKLVVPTATAALRRAVERGALYARGTALARDLANTPAADLPPLALARAARRLARPGLHVRVHDRRSLARLRMQAILGVGRGSQHPPCLIELVYRPRGPLRRRIALVGKGITFDSGGLSIKSAESMQAQKRDMAGGAVVLGVMSVLPALRLPIEVRGYVPAAENMPSGTAMRPGDVLRACNGTTIEVLNTDAEGRLVLADALAYAASRRPDLIIDFATLTAAVRSALGPRCAGILGTDRALLDAMLRAAAEADELLWELPLITAYRRDLDSRVADLKNIGDGHAGTIVAALFLREFVAARPWVHVDFSSTVMSEGFPCHPKGASGYGVRTVLRCLTALAADAAGPRSRRRRAARAAVHSARSPAKRRAQAAEQK